MFPRPEEQDVEEQQTVGAFTTYKKSLEKSIDQFYELGVIPQTCTNLILDIKDGFDGAGSQPQIHDRSVKHIFDRGDNLVSMEMVGYVILKVTDVTVSVSNLIMNNNFMRFLCALILPKVGPI